MSWLLIAAKQYLPEEIRRHPVPPLPPRPKKTRKQTKQAMRERDEQRRSRDIRYQQGEEQK